MRNFVEDITLGIIQANKHRALKRKLRETKVIRIPGKERALQCSTKEYLHAVLIPEMAQYYGYEASLGLGIYTITESDSEKRIACKNFYNDHIKGAQNKLQEKGVEKGAADGFIIGKCLWFPILWLEAKLNDNKLSPDQEEFRDRQIRLGNKYEVYRSIEDLRTILKKYNIPTREKDGCL